MKKAFEKIVGRGENAGKQDFLLFPKCFLLDQRKKIIIEATSNLSSANAFNLVTSKILSFAKALVRQANGFFCYGWKMDKTCRI